jgi:hypothetical protein
MSQIALPARPRRVDLVLRSRTRRVLAVLTALAFIAAPAFAEPPSCTSRILVHERRNFTGPPPLDMPSDLSWAYTRCGAIPRAPRDYYVDDTNEGRPTHYKYGSNDMHGLIKSAESLARMPNPLTLGKRGWLAAALQRHRDEVKGKRAVVFGSMTPMVETLLLAFGAAEVVTVEYNLLTYEHPSVRTTTPPVMEAALREGREVRFDVAVSLSSFDHDGLGRYGDPLCPDGDLLSNDAVRDLYLKPGGLYLLTVPIGPDVVVWNLHRRYGKVRLGLLLEGWDEVERVGWTDDILTKEVSYTMTTEPVFVLRAPSSTATSEGKEGEL